MAQRRAVWGFQMKKLLLPVLLLLAVGLALLLVAPLALRAWVGQRYDEAVYSRPAAVPARPVAIVFGAGYLPSGRLSAALADRMEAAMALYRAGAVNKLLLTGDNRFADYNEPAAMAAYAEARGVPREDLVLDYAGRRTYDSCYRAGVIFGVERAVLVTQGFHLPRALYTCDHLGLEVIGLAADRQAYGRAAWYSLRELFALARAWLDLELLKPQPVLGDPIPVDWSQRCGQPS
jgi:SanA protein